MKKVQDYAKIVDIIDKDLQIESDFRLNKSQKAQLALTQRVRISYLAMRPYIRRIHKYLAYTSERDRCWGCIQDIATFDYIIYIID